MNEILTFLNVVVLAVNVWVLYELLLEARKR